MTTRIDARIARPEFTIDVDVEFAPGTTTALVGPNGAGKSTVANALAGLVAIDSGRIVIDGRTVDQPESGTFVSAADRRVGLVFQERSLFPHLSVLDNVAFGPAAMGARRSEARERALEWLRELAIEDLAKRRPDELSGGQAQRVALARTLAVDPAVLVLDEPMTALDVESRAAMRRLLASHLAAFPGPRVVITHDPADVFGMADEVVVMERGRVVQHGSTDEIRRRPATSYVAAFAGRNLLNATAEAGQLTIAGSPQRLQSADRSHVGAVLVTIAPSAIALHHERPQGSPRNTWHTSIATVESLGDVVRVVLSEPLALSVDLTPGAVASMGLGPGSPIWASIKATEVGLTPAP